MASSINSLANSGFASLNSLFNNGNGKNQNVSNANNAFSSLNDALSKGNKEGIMNAAKELQAGQAYGSSFAADMYNASFTQSGNNFSFQLQVLNMSGAQGAFNNGSTMGAFSSLQATYTTINISGDMSDVGAINDILSKMGYDGKSFGDLTQSDAAQLISDDGFFGIDNTAKRVADFVINGAGDNLEMLKAGLEGVKQGYNEAQKMWGGQLPEISQKTQDKLLEMINKRIEELGGNAMNIEA